MTTLEIPMKNYLKLSVCIAAALAYGALLILRPFSVACYCLGIFVCLWLSAVIHEAGHLLCYILLHLKWKRLRLCCFIFEPGKGLLFDPEGRFFSASCTCAYNPDIPFWRYAIALLAGGATTLLLGAICVFLSPVTHDGLASFFQCLGLMSIANGLYNLLLPFSADRTLLRHIKKAQQ